MRTRSRLKDDLVVFAVLAGGSALMLAVLLALLWYGLGLEHLGGVGSGAGA